RAAALIATSMGDPARMAAELKAIRAEIPMTSALAAHLRYVDGIASFQRGEFLPAATALDAASRETVEQGLIDHAFRAEAGVVAARARAGRARDRTGSARPRAQHPLQALGSRGAARARRSPCDARGQGHGGRPTTRPRLFAEGAHRRRRDRRPPREERNLHGA